MFLKFEGLKSNHLKVEGRNLNFSLCLISEEKKMKEQKISKNGAYGPAKIFLSNVTRKVEENMPQSISKTKFIKQKFMQKYILNPKNI